ncbi:PBP1A family penicillin-binding protein [Sphingomonas paeninsulae]|uniref:Penicillin-binding protein 1A n=1 Tax=Sphingomonas paeninsulae TaxID=2319844 RepID=A0A494TK40_SPHPE|nr:PBP1A family penicillin-binding protein [Sphingomonas paeninsulae]
MAEPEDEPLKLRLTREGGAALGWGRGVWANRIGRSVVLAVAALIVVWFGVWMVFARDLPDAHQLLAYQPPLPTNVRGYDGTPIHSYARERRVQLSFDEYPKLVIDAFISAEDKTFFSHGGVDYTGVAGAVVDYVSKIGSGRRARGGSTITQQVAKNLLVGNEYSIGRKVKEAILAYRIEAALSKKQILEIYLNQIFLGRNAYGVQSASRAYFGKDVGELTLPEAAYLAILPKAPSNYDPDRDTKKATDRRNYVLTEMNKNGYITDDQYAAARSAPLGTVNRVAARETDVGDYFMEEVRRSLIAKFGETAKDGPYSVYSGGLWVRSSLDPALQTYAQDALRDGLLRFDRGHGWSGPSGHIAMDDEWPGKFAAANIGISYKDWRTAVVLAKTGGAAQIGFANGSSGTMSAASATMPRHGTATSAFSAMQPGDIIVVAPEGSNWALRNVPEVSGGMMVQNPHTGQVLAMQGGFDARLASFNRATQALRQPGSSFKPFVYAAALDHGMTPASIIVDGPFCVYQGARLGQKCFRNFGNARGAGPQTMRWGVEQSRNLMTVRAASETGMDNVVKMADAVGISAPGKPYPKVLAIALGAGETTVMRMTNAFSILANNGRALKPTLIDFVQDRNGKVIYRADGRPCDRCNMAQYDGKPMPRPPASTKQVIDPMTAYQVVHIAEGVVQRGTATVLRDLNRPIFGKTGTTSGPTNVWFVGGSQDLVGGIYMGFDTPRSMGGYAQGGRIAAPIFDQFAKRAMKDMPVVPFRATAGIRMVRIDRRSGKRVYGVWPNIDDPKAAVIWEAFKPESEPRRSIRKDELPVARPKAAAKAQSTNRPDSDFLQRQGGIY